MGEVDAHKVQRVVDFARRHRKEGVGFTTAYSTWKAAASLQVAHKNIPPSNYVWIREDSSKHDRAESVGKDESTPFTIPSTPA